MPGVRLHHPSLKNCTVALESSRKYREPFNCPLCGVTHVQKVVHLTLDNNGDVIVSKEAWAEMKKLPGLPFEMENEVKKPPALILSMNGTQQDENVEHIPFTGRST